MPSDLLPLRFADWVLQIPTSPPAGSPGPSAALLAALEGTKPPPNVSNIIYYIALDRAAGKPPPSLPACPCGRCELAGPLPYMPPPGRFPHAECRRDDVAKKAGDLLADNFHVAIWAFQTLRRRGVTQSAATAAVCTPGYASARVDPALLQKVAQEWEDQLGLAERVHGDIGDFLRANPVNWQLSLSGCTRSSTARRISSTFSGRRGARHGPERSVRRVIGRGALTSERAHDFGQGGPAQGGGGLA